MGESRLRALYFTRATAPSGDGPLYHHIGIYAYRRDSLQRFVTLPSGVLEKREKLEQLRALEAGMRIDVAVVDEAPLGVDTPADLDRARSILATKGRREAVTRKRIVFQGEAGANSHIACREAYPGYEATPQPTFEDCFQAVAAGEAELAMIPIENSVAGRVADIHHLLPSSRLSIIAEHFMPVHHQLLGVRGARIDQLEVVQSHVQALGQCRQLIRRLGLVAEVAADTAGSARHVAELGDPKRAALASRLAAEIYGLQILAEDVEDETHNTTRFVVFSAEESRPPPGNGRAITSFIFRVRNVPAALYKALGGFATNGVNMTKLESYQLGGRFFATLFYADVEGHPEDHNVKLALEELEFYSAEFRIVGVYPASPFRTNIAEPEANRDLRPMAPHPHLEP
jgi:prephenate dehydratase